MVVVEILVLKGASPSSVAISCEMIETANRLRALAGRPPAFAMRLAGSGARVARAAVGLLSTETPSARPGVVIVPGLALATEAAIVEGLARRDMELARRRLAEVFAQGAEVACSCSAVFLVASAGLLEGRRATTSWWLSPLFRRLYPTVRLEAEAMLVTDGRVMTGGAAMAQMDVMLSVIARHGDSELAARCARYMLLDARSSQSRYMAISFLTAGDERISQVERWLRDRLREPISVSAMADVAGMAPRTFARRLERTTGLSPVRFLQRLRLEHATELLETTHLTLEEIAGRVGYAEPSTLRRLFRRQESGGARNAAVQSPSAPT